MFYKKRMTITPHFFSSLIIHILLLAYLLTLPLYRGSISLKSLGNYFVHLEGGGPTEASPPLPAKKERSGGTKVIARAETIPLHKVESGMEETIRHVEEKTMEPQKEPEAGNVQITPQKEPITAEAETPLHQSALRETPVQEKEPPDVKKESDEKLIAKVKEPEVTKPVPIEKKIEPVKPATKVKPNKEPVDTKALSSVEKPAVPAEPSTISLAAEKKVEETKQEKKVVSEERTAANAELEKAKNMVRSESVREERRDAEPVKTLQAKADETKISPEAEKGINKKDEVASHQEADLKPDKTVPPQSKGEKTKGPGKVRQQTGRLTREKIPGSDKQDVNKGMSGERGGKAAASSPLAKNDKPIPAASGTGASPPGNGSSESVSQGQDKEGPVVETKNKTEIKAAKIAEEKKPSAGIPVSEILLPSDIKIEIFLKDPGISNVSSHLYRRAHPADERAREKMKQKEIGTTEEDSKEGPSARKILRVAKADKGLYTFVMINRSRASHKADVTFFLFEKKESERIKNFKSVELAPNAELKIRFIIPEGVFWDDEEYFTGSIESSDSMTKFNDKAGIVWKEEKNGGGL